MNQARLLQLAQKLLEGAATPQEYDELAYAIEADESGELAGRIAEVLNPFANDANDFDDAKWQAIADRILTIDRTMPGKKPAKLYSIVRKMAAAALIILIAGAGIYFLFSHTASKSGNIAEPLATKDVKAPSSINATLTLSNGEKIILDSVSNGVLSVQGNRSVVLGNGQLNYVPEKIDNAPEQVLYNTLTVPRGSKIISVVLSDGSKVWLNSESSLRYPIAFTGAVRKVELTGEGYFEVAKNVTRPFIVSTGETNVKVLGTTFNINAYANEQSTKVTLVEGSVNVSTNLVSKLLKPSQQAVINDDINVHSSFNMADVLAWKNGRFAFNGSDIQQVMRDLARWYDLEVVYTKTIKEKFHVEMTRNTNLSTVFKILEATGGVHFKIVGNKITVMP